MKKQLLPQELGQRTDFLAPPLEAQIKSHAMHPLFGSKLIFTWGVNPILPQLPGNNVTGLSFGIHA